MATKIYPRTRREPPLCRRGTNAAKIVSAPKRGNNAFPAASAALSFNRQTKPRKEKRKEKKTKCAGPRRKPITQESLATRRYLATLYEGLRKGRQPGIANERKRSPSRTYCKSLSHTTSRTEYRIAFAQPLDLGNEFVIGCCGVARRNDSLNEETYQMSAANPFLRSISAFSFSEAV